MTNDVPAYCVVHRWSRGDSTDMLRAVWEALLEDASGCVDESRQPRLLVRVKEVIEWCVQANISVKYGRKVRTAKLLCPSLHISLH